MVDAREYHAETKHTPESVRSETFTLDRETKPRPYKLYRNVPRIEPPAPPDPPDTPVLEAIATADATSATASDSSAVDAQDLVTLCEYATGVTKELTIQGQELRFRAAACTGKLYHVDLYAVTGPLESLDPGVYHFDPDSGAFDLLREGDYRGVLAAAAGQHPAVATAPVTVVATSEWWRNAWKYRTRTYRHAFWDSGTILANLLAVAHGAGHRATVVTGFVDDPVVRLLGLDPDSEAPLELVSIGRDASVPPAPTVSEIDPDEVPVSSETVSYPLVPDAWRQSRLADGDTVTAWREQCATAAADTCGTRPQGDGETVVLDPVDPATASGRPVDVTITRRGSLREYSHDPVSARKVATVLDRALRGVPTDCGDAGVIGRLVDCYCLVHAVDGVPSGAYQYHPDAAVLEYVGDTDRRTAGYLALDQTVVGDAAVNVYLMADVDTVVAQVGNRGYRLAQLIGGICLGRLYLATYAHRALGGRGFTFYDDEVTDHLSPRAATQTPLTLFAFGRPTT